MKPSKLVLALLVALLPFAAAAEERVLQGIAIIGNQELPKALFIVPWKPADAGEALPAPAGGLVDAPLDPLDPEVFRREMAQRRALEESQPR